MKNKVDFYNFAQGPGLGKSTNGSAVNSTSMSEKLYNAFQINILSLRRL